MKGTKKKKKRVEIHSETHKIMLNISKSVSGKTKSSSRWGQGGTFLPATTDKAGISCQDAASLASQAKTRSPQLAGSKASAEDSHTHTHAARIPRRMNSTHIQESQDTLTPDVTEHRAKSHVKTWQQGVHRANMKGVEEASRRTNYVNEARTSAQNLVHLFKYFIKRWEVHFCKWNVIKRANKWMLFHPDGFYYGIKMMGNKWCRGRWEEQSHPSCYDLKAKGHTAGGGGGLTDDWMLPLSPHRFLWRHFMRKTHDAR